MSMRSEDEQDPRVRQLLSRLITGQEDERQRIARDLHDHVGQQITALRLRTHHILRNLPADHALRNELAELDALSAEIDRDVSRLAWELRPPPLNELGLAGALEHFVRRWSSRHGIDAEFRTNGHPERLDPQIETCLFRIAQESLHNVLKHSSATRVVITLGGDRSDIVLSIEDNGIGFSRDTHHAGQEGGIGLVGMEERATLAHGMLEIDTAPGRGATIVARIPRRSAEDGEPL